MQNTIIKEFENHPGIVAAIFNEGGRFGETRSWLETFWDNYYMRGSVLFDETGQTVRTYYGQPNIGLPFGRGFIIDMDGNVALPYFGHNPAMVIEKIYELLASEPLQIDMIPDNPPVVVPAGGSFSFTGVLANNTGEILNTDVWIMLRLPGGALYGPIQQFNNIQVAARNVISVPGVLQYIPVYAPSGTYDYIAYCGDYPSNSQDSASFEFTVIPPAEGGADSWHLSNWFSDETGTKPLVTVLYSNYPNPFNPITTIRYDLATVSNVRIDIYNLMGQRIETLINSKQAPGKHSISWDASNMASGIYFYKLTAGNKVFTKRMTLLK